MFSLHYITDIFTSVIQISARHKAIGMMQFKIKHFQVRPSVHTSHWNMVIEVEEPDYKF